MMETEKPLAPREAFGKTLTEIARKNERIVALDADLASSTKMNLFREELPERFLEIGIAEQNMLDIAAGLALMNMIPFCGSFAAFISRRACDQIAVEIGHTGMNVKMVGAYGGLTNGNNGATHQATEDIAIMRTIPNITVIEPADDLEMSTAVAEIVKHQGPVYLRCTRDVWPRVSPAGYRFQIGKAVKIRNGEDISLIACGMMVSQCVSAAEILDKEGIKAEVINVATIKPLDIETIIDSVTKTKAAVTAENHSVIGGLGSAVAEALGETYPAPMGRIGLQDTYGECGDNQGLLRKYHMDPTAIVMKAKQVLARKK
jgi:transketolase